MAQMKGRKAPPPRSVSKARGEAHLADLASIEIVLENGKRVEFEIADQLPPLSGPDAAMKELYVLPDRIAFFAAQRDRALHELRKAEVQYDQDRGTEYVLHYKNIDDNTTYSPSQALVNSFVDCSPPIRKKRIHLNALRKQYDALRSLVQAMEHRIYAARTIAQNAFKD